MYIIITGIDFSYLQMKMLLPIHYLISPDVICQASCAQPVPRRYVQ